MAEAVRSWELSDVRVVAGGNVALVATAGDVVVKVNPRGVPDDFAAEADALQFWRATGAAAELLDRRDDGHTLLLERLGAPLEGHRDALVILGRLAARLHTAGPAPPSFPHIGLGEPHPDDVVLHGDLHGGNALRAGDGWKVIDPKGLRGDRHADVWALIDPLAPVATVERVEVYARAAGLDPLRACAWTRARALATAPTTGDAAWSARLLRGAAALERANGEH